MEKETKKWLTIGAVVATFLAVGTATYLIIRNRRTKKATAAAKLNRTLTFSR